MSHTPILAKRQQIVAATLVMYSRGIEKGIIMPTVQQPSPAPATPKITTSPTPGKVPMRDPKISAIIGGLSVLLCLVPVVGLVLGVIAIRFGYKSITRDGATQTAWIGTVMGIGGVMIGVAIIIAAASFLIAIGRSAL